MNAIKLWFSAHPAWAVVVCFLVASMLLSYSWYGVRAKWFPGVETKDLPRWARRCQMGVELIMNIAQFVRIMMGQASVPPGYRPPPPLPPAPPPPAPPLN